MARKFFFKVSEWNIDRDGYACSGWARCFNPKYNSYRLHRLTVSGQPFKGSRAVKLVYKNEYTDCCVQALGGKNINVSACLAKAIDARYPLKEGKRYYIKIGNPLPN